MRHPYVVRSKLADLGWRAVSGVALLLLGVSQCYAQVPPPTVVNTNRLDQVIAKGEAESDRGEYADAVLTLTAALDEADRNPKTSLDTLDRILEALGTAQRDLEEADAAETTFLRLLKLREERHGPDARETAMAMNELGEVFAVAEHLEHAESWLKKALSTLEALPQPDEGDLALVMHNLAIAHYYRDENAEAEELWQRVLKIRVKLYGEKSSSAATTQYNLGWLAEDNGRLEEAREFFAQAADAYAESQGTEHPDLALSLVALADLDCRDYESTACVEALPGLARAIEIQRNAYGGAHPTTVGSMEALALAYEGTDRGADALALRRDLLAIAEEQGDGAAIALAQSYVDELIEALEAGADDDSAGVEKEAADKEGVEKNAEMSKDDSKNGKKRDKAVDNPRAQRTDPD